MCIVLYCKAKEEKGYVNICVNNIRRIHSNKTILYPNNMYCECDVCILCGYALCICPTVEEASKKKRKFADERDVDQQSKKKRKIAGSNIVEKQ